MLVLSAFALSRACVSGKRAILPLLFIAIAIALILVGLRMILPEVAEVIIGRIGETDSTGTIGHARFVGSILILQDVFREAPWAIASGVGPRVAEHLTVTYEYLANTVTKYEVEYGVVGFVRYLTMILFAQCSCGQNMLLFPSLTGLLFAGQNQ